MNQKQKKRIGSILCILALLSVSASLVLYALKQNINLFFTPTQLLATMTRPDQHVRLGGYVKKGSVQFDTSDDRVHFVVTDHRQDVFVEYRGVLPNLFREEQGVVVTGNMSAEHVFIAREVLAKHDEKYMPWPLKKELSSS